MLSPENPAATDQMFVAALDHQTAGRVREAAGLYQRVLLADPRHACSMQQLGVIACAIGATDGAIAMFRNAIAVDPRQSIFHANLGVALADADRPDEAIASYRTAIALQPGSAEAHLNLGNALKAARHLDAAASCFDQAIALRPDLPEAHFNRGMLRLTRGDLPGGWADYEWRWRVPRFLHDFADAGLPVWRGEAGHGRTLLIRAEQGFGDTLQFCRYAPLAARRGFRVVLEVQPPLVRLLGSLPDVTQIIARGDPLPACDLQCPMLSLPHAFATTLDTIPCGDAYLHPDPAAVASWAARLHEPGPRRKRVGLVWAGEPRRHVPTLAAIDRKRSLAPGQMAPILAAQGIRFFSLQKTGPTAPPDFPLLDLMDEMADFADTAALIANLDLVISADTAVAHLAAALGKPVWLLDRFDGCWRWLTDRTDSPWYPTLRRYGQSRAGDWATVIATVAADLARETGNA